MRNILAVFAAMTLGACGMGGSSAEVAAYQKTVSELQAAVATHQTDAAATPKADCGAEHQRYEDATRPRLTQLTSMSTGLDSCRLAMGHTGFSELRTMCGSMLSELDRHASVACAGDEAANHIEAAQHCEVMRGWLAQQESGAGSMMSMGGMMSGGRCTP